MTYQELRKRLRAEGFINLEIAAIHHHYLAARALGVPDDDIVFDRDHGMLVHHRSYHLMQAGQGRTICIDCENDTAFEVVNGKRLGLH
jgi:hypothetical protein